MGHDLLNISVMLKDGGYSVVKITIDMIGQLAKAIQEKGFEWITLKSGPIAVVGFMVIGNQTGDRVIILGDKGRQASDSTETA
ncbi:hypothetical protein [Paenibacillus sp. MBLB4367]|uniref:hypothetical protein n=1 Tax=Paenibacillus sp. MBLB4367 TaxID=3384767 RepID=UPI00390804CA